ncbi:hypothetical protein EVG20_g2333 [Dentipellis fragilis]|uniref:Uncharacterized protein n=1 Tax=Dentipellis fragilis TaxID=205917 RepID=A0A4Y9Z830_9AGAM|nr:hypothetical protein EVG20_g2333 [Dentipellis fragilis]
MENLISSQVDGENEVNTWLDSQVLAAGPRPIIERLKEASTDNIIKRTEHLVFKIEELVFYEEDLAPPELPPGVLVNALFDQSTTIYERRRPLRTDVDELFRLKEISLARFLLLICVLCEKLNKVVTEEERARYLTAGWQQKYRGTALKAFLRAMQWYEEDYREKSHYGRMIAIIQSSGSGKSRLVHELSLNYPVMNVNFRKGTDDTSGWPPGDRMALEFFKKQSDLSKAATIATKMIKGEEIAAAFLGALMGVIADEWDISLLMGDESLSRCGLPNSPEAERRETFFRKVSDRATDLLLKNEDILLDDRSWIGNPGRVRPEKTFATEKERRAYEDKLKEGSREWHQRLFKLFCQQDFDRVTQKLHEAGQTKFFLVLDECTALEMAKGNDSEGPRCGISLIAVQRILKAAEHMKNPVCFWFLLLDTNPSVVLFDPPRPITSSFRLTAPLQPLPPFVYLGFNQHIDRMRKEKAFDSLYLNNLKYSGRPYWSTLMPHDVVDTAIVKLFCIHEPKDFNPFNQHHVLAAFAARACLQFEENEATKLLAANAVSRHMRILLSVINAELSTTAPSEPVLAIAAAVALNISETTYNKSLHTLFRNWKRQNPVLAPGDMGELCSRLLLLLARDRATIRFRGEFVQNDTSVPDSMHRIHAIELHEFLTVLLGEPEKAFGLFEKGPAKQLIEFCKKKWINFTHFTRFEKEIDELTLDELEHAWFFGAAIQCCPTQAVIDGGFVYYDGSLDEPFDRCRLRFLPYQTTVRGPTASASTKTGLGLTAPPILHPGQHGTESQRVKPQTIVLLMDFKSTSTFQDNGQMSRLELRQAEATTCWRGYADPNQGEEEPANFFINVRGYSPVQYPVMLPFDSSLQPVLIDILEDQMDTELQAMEDEMKEAMYVIEQRANVQRSNQEEKEMRQQE